VREETSSDPPPTPLIRLLPAYDLTSPLLPLSLGDGGRGKAKSGKGVGRRGENQLGVTSFAHHPLCTLCCIPQAVQGPYTPPPTPHTHTCTRTHTHTPNAALVFEMARRTLMTSRSAKPTRVILCKLRQTHGIHAICLQSAVRILITRLS